MRRLFGGSKEIMCVKCLAHCHILSPPLLCTPTIFYKKDKTPGEFIQPVGMRGEKKREMGVPVSASTCMPTFSAKVLYSLQSPG